MKFLHAVKRCAREDRLSNQESTRNVETFGIQDQITCKPNWNEYLD
jgi:hypothetical protein